jgi:alanine racemase
MLEGVLTHFARADESDPAPTIVQETCFNDVIERLTAAGLRPPVIHAANSAATLTRPSAHFDLVRVGIAMYGLHPSSECPLPAEFRPVLSWKSQLSQVAQLPAGQGISYGHDYVTTRTERIGTIPVGYGDGFRRVSGNVVLVGGQQVEVVGRVCMDQALVQLDSVPEAKVGDGVVLIGSQGESCISAEDVAERWGTITHEIVCGISSRVPRVYVEDRHTDK